MTKMWRRNKEKGFTLIELLIVVAILGILAAVIIPNVGRFLGRGQEEALSAEFHDINVAVTALMTENGLISIPAPVGTVDLPAGTCAGASQDLTNFPDATSSATVPAGSPGKLNDPAGDPYDYLAATPDIVGYILFGHDIAATDGQGGPIDNGVRVNYVNFDTTQGWYVATSNGTIYACDGSATGDIITN